MCFLLFARETAGAARTRHSLRPLFWRAVAGTTRAHSRREIAGVCAKARLVHLAPLAGRGRRRREAKSPGEGHYPRVRTCRESPSPARKTLATSPRKRGEVKTARWLLAQRGCLKIKSEIQRRRPGQASESKRDPGPITTALSCCAKVIEQRLSNERH